MIRDLSKTYCEIVRVYRKAAVVADEHRDHVSNDLIVQRMAFHEKAIWMFNATLADQ